MEKSVYIVLSQSGSIPSKLLKFFTHDEYNHVSISLTPTLEQMYSFARLKPNNPFIGGFVEEGKDVGTFKKFNRTKAMVLEVKVSEDKFNAIKYFIEYFKLNKEQFKYNYFGVFLAALKLNWRPKHKFYCSQFVRVCLSCFNIENSVELPKVIKPIDFLLLENKKIVYAGPLSQYSEIN